MSGLEVFYQSRIAPNPGEEPFDDPSARVCGVEATFESVIFAHDKFDGNQRGRWWAFSPASRKIIDDCRRRSAFDAILGARDGSPRLLGDNCQLGSRCFRPDSAECARICCSRNAFPWDGCGLDVISLLKRPRPDARAIILTGYGNIATAVKAVKLGAVDYLLKPADADDIISALLAPKGGIAKAPSRPMSADRVRWEHIHRVYEICGRNVSETTRRLNMHRRTLQRILTRRAGLLERASSAGS